jgi:hypothetical protein
MARPGYLKARQARDKELNWLLLAQERLDNIDSLTDSSGRPLADALKEVQRKDATKAVEEHKQAAARAELEFASFGRLPQFKATRVYYDAVIPMQVSVTFDMFEFVKQECLKLGVTKPELFRRAMDLYRQSQQQPPMVENSPIENSENNS